MRSATIQRLCGIEAGQSKVFFVSMTNLEREEFYTPLHRFMDSEERRLPKTEPGKRGLQPRTHNSLSSLLPPLEMGFDSNPCRHILGHTNVCNHDDLHLQISESVVQHSKLHQRSA